MSILSIGGRFILALAGVALAEGVKRMTVAPVRPVWLIKEKSDDVFLSMNSRNWAEWNSDKSKALKFAEKASAEWFAASFHPSSDVEIVEHRG